jgi:hypothetical protein
MALRDSSDDMDVDAIYKAIANPVRREILAWLRDPTQNFRTRSCRLTMAFVQGRAMRVAAFHNPRFRPLLLRFIAQASSRPSRLDNGYLALLIAPLYTSLARGWAILCAPSSNDTATASHDSANIVFFARFGGTLNLT